MPPLTLLQRIQNLSTLQGGTPIEDAMINGAKLAYAPHGTANRGVNSTYAARIDGVPVVCFHKQFAGVDVAIANTYSQSPDSAPVNECAAWLLAKALGPPYIDLVPPCVYRVIDGQPGSLALGIIGHAHEQTPLARGHAQGEAAAFFDALIAQQDRHGANYRWDPGSGRLHLIDHGYAFAVPRAFLNQSHLLQARWGNKAEALTAAEIDALQRTLAAPDLFGLASVLEAPRADALVDRVKRMLARSALMRPGEF
ncbi:MAG: hypothetical protein KGJ98_10585 [Chloroflexota bacterium]|nr:hypothetical protein [Chloroflexota bacterium]